MNLQGVWLLIIDCEPTQAVSQSFSRLLTDQGADVLTVNSMADAWAMLTQFLPDAIFFKIESAMDVNACSFIKNWRKFEAEKGLPQVPTIALLPSNTLVNLSQFFPTGFHSYLSSSVEVSEIVAITRGFVCQTEKSYNHFDFQDTSMISRGTIQALISA